MSITVEVVGGRTVEVVRDDATVEAVATGRVVEVGFPGPQGLSGDMAGLGQYNPMESVFRGVGDRSANDTAALLAARAQLQRDGGGILAITRPHLITAGCLFDTTVPLWIVFSGAGELYCDFSGAETALNILFEWDGYTTPGPRIFNPRITLAGSAASGLSTAISIAYDTNTGGATNGPDIYGGLIIGEDDAYFLNGLTTENASHGTYDRMRIRGRGGVLAKAGAGIKLGNWAQGSVISRPNIRSFIDGILDTDINAAVASDYQAEGVEIDRGNIQRCTHGVRVALRDAEVAWRIHDCSFDQNKINLRCENLNGILASSNSMGLDQGTDHIDVLVYRTDGVSDPVAYTSKALNARVQGSRAFKRGDILWDVTAIAAGATTVITYVDVSNLLDVLSVTVDGSGHVTVHYSGDDSRLNNAATIAITGDVEPFQLIDTFKIGDLNRAADTFRLYLDDAPLSDSSLINGSTWAAYTGSATFLRAFSTGTLAEADIVWIDSFEGAVEANHLACIVADLDTTAKTMRLTAYPDGADIDSSTWSALTNPGRLTRYNRFAEIRGGNGVAISGNTIFDRAVLADLWPQARNIQIHDNQLIEAGAYTPIPMINRSLYPDTISYSDGSAVPGPTGPEGPVGPEGPQGEQGVPGDSGPTTFRPSQYGGDPTGVLSSTAAFNDMFDAVRAASSSATRSQPYTIDCTGGTWLIDGDGIDATNMRTAHNVVILGGVFNGKCTGEAMFDLTGSRWFKFFYNLLNGDATNTPECAVKCGRLSNGSSAEGHQFHAVVADGYFTRAAYFNYGSEVNKHFGCDWWNRYADDDAYCIAIQGRDIYSYTSQFQTAGTGSVSMLHSIFTGCTFQRPPLKTLTITNITQANPAVITYTGTDPANGDVMWVSERVNGMVEIRATKITVANLNAGAKTFECSGFDSTGFTAYTSGGAVNSRTGPAIFLSRLSDIVCTDEYANAYHEHAIRIDATGDTFGVRRAKLNMHVEGTNQYCYKFTSADVATTWYDLELSDRHTQAVRGLITTDATTAVHIMRRLKILAGDVGWSVGMFSDPARFSLQGDCDIDAITARTLPADPTAFSRFQARTIADNRTPQIVNYVQRSLGSVAASGTVAIDTHYQKITVTGLTTAAGASDTVTITTADLLTTDQINLTTIGGTNTGGIPVLVAAISAGSYTIKLFNAGASAFNGSIIISAIVTKAGL